MMSHYNVREFGATGNGNTDDTIAINNAISAAAKNLGGIVFFPAGVYKITSTLLITADHIILRGVGGGVDPQSLHGASAAVMVATAPSRIVWGGGATTDGLVRLEPSQLGTPPMWVNHMGCGLEDIVLDAAGIAQQCFISHSHNRIRMKGVTVTRYLRYGFNIGITNNAQLQEWSSSQNYFADCIATNYGEPITNDVALILWGDAVKGNINYSQFFGCLFVANPGFPPNYMTVSIEQADNCQFYGCSWNGNLYLHADDTGTLSTGDPHPSCAIAHTFYGCGGPIIAKGSVHGGVGSNQNVAYGYRMGNGVSYPIIERGADLTVYCTTTSTDLNPSGQPGTGSISYGSTFSGVHVFGSNTSIASNALTNVVWSNTFWDPLVASSSGQIRVPAGVKWVRATAQVIWDANTTGSRYAEITRAGLIECRQWMPVSVGDGATMLQSHWFPTDPGDVIGLNVMQTSGVILRLNSSSFLSVEYR